jgi:hypothetical protein
MVNHLAQLVALALLLLVDYLLAQAVGIPHQSIL